ncbi:MAG TPA: hypothetical protein VLT90_07750 [Terriglobales bacterium]|nr:hypothetical protein [Terriglobales bacterium]
MPSFILQTVQGFRGIRRSASIAGGGNRHIARVPDDVDSSFPEE